MNIDMIPEGIDPEIDVRLTAMVLGEASDFEAAQLYELMSQRPELAAWYQQLQRLHGELNQWALLEQHLQGVTKEEQLDESSPWTLSPDKRASVLAVLGQGKVETPAKVLPLTMWQKLNQYRSKRRGLWIAAGVAASLLMICSSLMLNRSALQSVALSNKASARYQAYYDTDAAAFPPAAAGGGGGGRTTNPFSDRGRRGTVPAEGWEAPKNELSAAASTSAVPVAPGSTAWSAPNAFDTTPSESGWTDQGAAPGRVGAENNLSYTPQAGSAPATAQPPVTVPGGGAMMLGGVVRPTSPAEPAISSPPSVSNGSGEASDLFGLAVKPTDDAKVADVESRAGDLVETTEALRQEVDQPSSPLSDKSAYRLFSAEAPANSADGRKSQSGEQQLGSRLDSGIVDETRSYFGKEAASNAPVAPAAPAGPTSVDRLAELVEQKSQTDSEMDPFSGNVPAKKPSSSAGAKGDDKVTLEKSLREDDFGTITGQGQSDGDNVDRMSGVERKMADRDLDGLETEGKQQAAQALSVAEGFLGRDDQSKQDLERRWDVEKAKKQSEWSELKSGSVDQKERKLEDLAAGDVVNREKDAVEEFETRILNESEGVNDFKDESENLALQGITTPGLRSKFNRTEDEKLADADGTDRGSRGLGRERELRAELFRNEGAAASREIELRQQLTEKARPTPGLNETLTEKERFSTFSLHVSDVSFKLALDSLAKGQWPEAAKIRLEEFLNAFDYQDPLPSEEEKVACQIEQAIHPFLMQRNVLRVAMRTSATGRNSATPLRLTLLLDNSGSMQRADRAQTVRRAFETLAKQLTPADQVTLISFANEPKLRADRVNGNEILNFVNILENSPVEGGTNIEAALRLALEKAQEAKTEGAQSRVILMTDGAVNLGDADPSSLSQLVLKMRDSGIAFDAAGISAQDLNDEVLEALTRQGDGRYYLLDNAEQVDGGFAQQIAGALRPSAKNVKVQVEFNPQRVRSYKLLGFEKHVLNKEDFRNDKVDAAELAAAEAGVALYHYEVLPDGIGDVGSVSVRFQDMATGLMVEKRWPIAYEPSTSRLDQANSSMKLATSAVLFAAHLKGEPLGENVDLQSVAETLGSLDSSYSNLDRVQQLRQMVESARQIAGASSGKR